MMSKKTYLASRAKAYTLIEVLLASMILGLAAFGLMGLLQASDKMGYRGRTNGAIAALVGTRAGELVSIPFGQLQEACVAVPHVGNSYIFQRGKWDGTPNLATFPFLVAGEKEESVTSVNFLAFAKPMPGSIEPRGVFPYAEVITLLFDDSLSDAGSVTVTYELWWQDSYVGTGAMTKAFTFTFTKYDTLRY